MSLPRLECIAAATVMRVLRPGAEPCDARSTTSGSSGRSTGFSYSLAQSELAQRATRPSERAWSTISGRQPAARPGPPQPCAAPRSGPACRRRCGASTALLHSDFEPPLTAAAIASSGVDAATELAGASASATAT